MRTSESADTIGLFDPSFLCVLQFMSSLESTFLFPEVIVDIFMEWRRTIGESARFSPYRFNETCFPVRFLPLSLGHLAKRLHLSRSFAQNFSAPFFGSPFNPFAQG